jgi:hypothetical protein
VRWYNLHQATTLGALPTCKKTPRQGHRLGSRIIRTRHHEAVQQNRKWLLTMSQANGPAVPDLTVNADPRPEFFVALLGILVGAEELAPPTGVASTEDAA